MWIIFHIFVKANVTKSKDLLHHMLQIHKEIDLKQALKESKTTQTALARHLKLSRQQVNRIVNGSIDNITIQQLKSILSYLGYKVQINITC